MKILFYSDHIVFIEDKIIAPGFHPIPEEILKAYKIQDIPNDIYNKLSENDIDSIVWFFVDLETPI